MSTRGAAAGRAPATVRDASRRGLGTAQVAFIVIAAAAPMASMIGNVPLAILYGGPGLPVAYLLASLVLVCFSVGYAAMNRRVISTGAFYTYVGRAMGKPAGVAAAYVAVLSYVALSCGLVAVLGYFTSLVLAGLGIAAPWYLCSAVGVALVAVLGHRSVDLSAKVLGLLMAAEFAVLLVLDVLAVGQAPATALPVAVLAPSSVLSGSVGIALMFAFTSFIGFESGALYAEETRDPRRTIPRATYIALASTGAFYVLTTWVIIGASGGRDAPAAAAQDSGELVLDLLGRVGGVGLYNVAAVLFCTSVLASFLALHSAAARYLFALGREGVLPTALGRLHARHGSPHVGSITVTVAETVSFVVMAALGASPYTVFAPGFIGLGTLGVIALQAAAAASVIAFFWRREDRDTWRCVVAPGIGLVGLGSAFVLAVTHYGVLTSSTNPVIGAMPVLLAVVAAAGAVAAVRLRSRRPATYARLLAVPDRVAGT